MPRKGAPARVRAHRVCTIWEAAETLGVHRKTVTRWIRDRGLRADTVRRPWLIDGRDLKAFLGQRQARSRCRLALHHCYCLGCKGPREPDGRIADYLPQTAATGNLTGLCPDFGSLMHKVVRRADLASIGARIDVTIQQANPGLMSRADPPLAVPFGEQVRPHVEARL